MIAKHLEGLANFLLDLAGVPTQSSAPAPAAQPGDPEGRPSSSHEEASLQPVPVKSFLHYL
jgi:hypothetical protein